MGTVGGLEAGTNIEIVQGTAGPRVSCLLQKIIPGTGVTLTDNGDHTSTLIPDATVAVASSSTVTGTALGATGLTGTVTAIRIVGANAGVPTTGAHLIWDVSVDTTANSFWLCTVAGTPGTWVQIQAGTVAASAITVAMLATATANRILTNMEAGNSQRVFRSPLSRAAAPLLLVDNTAYFVYLGRVGQAWTSAHVKVTATTGGNTQTAAEAGLFTTPLAPNGASQSLTKVGAASFTPDLTTTGVLSLAFAQAVVAGTHLWAGFRAHMGVTQPTLSALVGDMSSGAILSLTSAGVLTGAGPFTGSLIADTGAANCPDIVVTLD